MKPFFSIISIQTNSYSNETLAVGLIIVADKKYFSYSSAKLQWLKKLTIGNDLFFLAETALKKIENLVKTENNTIQYKTMNQLFSLDYFTYLNQYSAGAITFSEPVLLDIKMNDTVFANYYEKIVGEPLISEKKVIKSTFNKKINQLFNSKEVEPFADINFQLDSNKFEGVLKDTKISLITKNGSISAIQTIDFSLTINSIVSHLYEAQIICGSLKKFGEINSKQVDKIKLAIEVPNDNTEQKELFDKVYTEKNNIFEFCEYNNVESFVEKVASSKKYSKFSELLND